VSSFWWSKGRCYDSVDRELYSSSAYIYSIVLWVENCTFREFSAFPAVCRNYRARNPRFVQFADGGALLQATVYEKYQNAQGCNYQPLESCFPETAGISMI
jgi:hypothetical protein